jgi:hypothetical protein
MTDKQSDEFPSPVARYTREYAHLEACYLAGVEPSAQISIIGDYFVEPSGHLPGALMGGKFTEGLTNFALKDRSFH